MAIIPIKELKELMELKELEERPGRLFLRTKLTVRKFASDEAHQEGKPYEVSIDDDKIGKIINIRR